MIIESVYNSDLLIINVSIFNLNPIVILAKMPVVRPHNQQKGTKNRKPKPRNANQRKDTPSDLSATKNKSIIGDHHDSDNDETVYVASKK